MENEMISQLLQPLSAGIFFIFLLVFMVVSIVLNYHWTHYDITKESMKKILTWYFSVAGILLLVMALSLAFILGI